MFNNFSLNGIGNFLRFNKRGPVIFKESGLRLKVLDKDQTNDINLSGADPIQDQDFVTLKYLTTNTQSILTTAKATNTDITTNLNGNTGNYITNVPVFGNTETDNGTLYYDFISATELKIKFSGKILILGSIHITANTQRTSLNVRTKINGNPIGSVGATGYIRTNNGHDASSLHINTIIDVVPNDIISIGARREANAGSVFMSDVGTSEIDVLRLR